MVGLEVLETAPTYLWVGQNIVATWCHCCLLSLGHYGSHEQDWAVYTQKVAKFSMKRCCIVGNTTYDSREGVANSFYMPMGRYG